MPMPAIHSTCKSVIFAIEMYEGKAKEHSYGVRDEYRLSGFAAIEVSGQLRGLGSTLFKVSTHALDVLCHLVRLLGQEI
ncbi:hypothetical protein BU15DRAFT_83271 [Melanogaster broomeanus]|nr:hypothetical protein BU15DRAFT_83271 [Melanogaster broomeanus]